MQPTNPLQPRGSFVKPQDIAKTMEQAAAANKPAQAPTAKPSPEKPTDVPVGQLVRPTDVPAETEGSETKETSQLEKIAEIKKTIETDLEIQLTNEDVTTYLFKGVLSKEVSIIPGRMKGTLTTLRIKELQDIDVRMATIRDSAKNTAQGLANEESIVALSYSWTHAAGRPLGATPIEREDKIRSMGALLIEAASTARIRFDTLLRITMNDRNTLKK